MPPSIWRAFSNEPGERSAASRAACAPPLDAAPIGIGGLSGHAMAICTADIPAMTDDQWIIRPATMADVAPLRDLIESGYRGAAARGGWTHEADLLDGQRSDEAMLADAIGAPDRLILLAQANGGLIGCVEIARVADGRSYLGLLTVAPARQRGGLGKALLSAAEDQAMAHFAAAFIEMTVIRQRAELIAYYARRGYHPTGERRPFPYGDTRYGAPRRDDLEFVVLEKQLIRSAA